MKNLSKRNKIVVGIVGIVIVVILAGFALLQPGGRGLFGATVELTINPLIAVVGVGQKIQLSVANADSSCQWSTNSGVVSLSPTSGASIYAGGISAGTAIVTVNCTTGTGSRTVTVTPPPPTATPVPPTSTPVPPTPTRTSTPRPTSTPGSGGGGHDDCDLRCQCEKDSCYGMGACSGYKPEECGHH